MKSRNLTNNLCLGTLCKDRVTGLMDELMQHKQVKLTSENVKALQGLLQLSIEQQEECPICYEPFQTETSVISSCAHCFHRTCIEQVIKIQAKCPMCRGDMPDDTCLVQPAEELSEENQTAKLSEQADAPSSKVKDLLTLLKATAAKDKGTKTVIFSQWTSFLNIVQKHISLAGFRFCRLDGSMSAAARDAAIDSLNTDDKCTIMLASLSVCSVGLNLTAASQVIMTDSWWAPAIEDQATDRVYRLGQTKPVIVWRLTMEDSIESRVLEIQADKRNLVKTAFGEGATGKRGRERAARFADIQRLLS